MPVENGYMLQSPAATVSPSSPGNDKDFRRPGLKVFNPFKK